MSAQKVIFVIPGFRQKSSQKAYKEISKMVRKQGYSPIVVNIPWKNRTISQNTSYFLKKYRAVPSRKKYILGFSYGAMIAFIASTKVHPQGLILCSLSPYFREDVLKIHKNAVSTLMSKRYEDFENLQSETLAKKVKAKKVLMLYGAEEARSLIKRVCKTFQEIPKTEKLMFRIKKTEHNIGNRNYLKTINTAASQLL